MDFFCNVLKKLFYAKLKVLTASNILNSILCTRIFIEKNVFYSLPTEETGTIKIYIIIYNVNYKKIIFIVTF